MPIPWSTAGCGYPSPPMYPPGDDRPEQRTAGTNDVVRDEVKKLYARGEITREQYREALERLERGSFSLDDLWELRRQASVPHDSGETETSRMPGMQEGLAAKSNSGAGLRSLKQKWEEVGKAEREIGGTIEAVTGSMERLKKEMQHLEELARITLQSDEAQARAYLEQRQGMVEQVSELKARLDGLKADSVRLNVLKARLEAKIMEQEAQVQGDMVSRLEKELQDLP